MARFVLALPGNRVTEVYGKQLLRSGSSVGANYRSACRARSDAEMAAKLGIAEEEADESQYWLELLMETGLGDVAEAKLLHEELNEIISILVVSRRTLNKRLTEQGNQRR